MKITDWLLPQGSPKKKDCLEGTTVIIAEKSPNWNKSSMPPKGPSPSKDKPSTPGTSGGSKQGRQSGGGQGQGSSGGGTTTTTAGSHSTLQRQDVILPQSKIKSVMKSSPEVEAVGQDVVYLITKATEMFIDHITTQTFNVGHRSKNVEYKHLAEMAHKNDNLEFLRDIIPVKMTAKQALQEIAKQKAQSTKEILD